VNGNLARNNLIKVKKIKVCAPTATKKRKEEFAIGHGPRVKNLQETPKECSAARNDYF